ncbi:hypothetical protein [Marinomonas sp. IMCC 4694]|nr:hypothetical protein [Marinomonas sp. IMCC 4694]
MANWIIRLDEVFKPLINLMREQQNLGQYSQAFGLANGGSLDSENTISRS